MIFSKLKAKLHKSKKKIIPLERLAQLWVGEEFTMEKEKPACPDSRWNSNEINQFHFQYVEPRKELSGHTRQVIWQILSMLDEHGDIPSSGNDDERIFAEITLLEHTLNVARISIDMIKTAYKNSEMITGRLLIAALGHSLGILSNAETIGGVTAKSILILEPIIADLPFKQDVITAIATYQDKKPKTEEANILKVASLRARKIESERAKMLSETWDRSYLDINKIKAIIKEE